MADQYNLEAEKMLLGCLLLESSLVKELEVEPKQLSFHHEPLLRTMINLDNDNEDINRATLLERLGPSFMNQVNIGEMMRAVPSIYAVKKYEQIIIRTWQKTQLRQTAQTFLVKTEEVVDDATVDSFLSSVRTIETFGAREDDFQLKKVLVTMYDQVLDGVVKRGLQTSFTTYYRLTNGHSEGQFIIVAARPSVGKTAFALNVAMGHMKENAFGHLYSLEMSKKQFLNRMISAKGKIDSQKLRDPMKRFDADDWKRYTQAISDLSEENVYISDRSSVKIPEIYATTRKIMRQHPDKQHFIIIDYLQLLQSAANKQNRQEEVSEISRSLKAMARDLSVPVIALSQLSRGVESRADKRPNLSDLRESGSLEQDADVVAFLYRDDYYNRDGESDNSIEIIIAKQREGPVGTVELGYEKAFNLFVNKKEE
ncbi:replicative DNA helicase [Salipaludibacillus neizhouensis]|uniref:DNA 5'-3' helicase n=1 Tax=Salipaludibacillus neizhouensis TaxID=885475 RepID=A0A3A9K5Q6_9BACI|nr:replicative DNA helicase [Salipaludibacillus neizhouensis]RKL65023.1 replicative DNA helicase [Salipaludibacillus neizhouensis]